MELGRSVEDVSRVLRMMFFPLRLGPGIPFNSPRGGSGLQEVDAIIGLDRGMA